MLSVDQQQQLGVDWGGPLPADADDANIVNVDPVDAPISDADYLEMVTLVNPLETSAEHGTDLYINALTFTFNKISMYM